METVKTETGEIKYLLNRKEAERCLSCMKEIKLWKQNLPSQIPEKDLKTWTDEWYVKALFIGAIGYAGYELGRNSR